MSDVRDSYDSYLQTEPAAKRRGWHIPAGFVVFLLVIGFVGFIIYITGDRVKGDITLATPAKSWTMHLNRCSSGQRKEYFGVAFFDSKEADTGGRISMPEDGEPHIALNRPDADYAVTYSKSDCKVWDVDLQRTNSTYNGIWGMTGHARFDCTTTDETASHATGDVQFGSCH